MEEDYPRELIADRNARFEAYKINLEHFKMYIDGELPKLMTIKEWRYDLQFLYTRDEPVPRGTKMVHACEDQKDEYQMIVTYLK